MGWRPGGVGARPPLARAVEGKGGEGGLRVHRGLRVPLRLGIKASCLVGFLLVIHRSPS